MFRTSRLQKIVKVPQVQVIDEVAKVPRSMRRQVPMIQDETQKDQKPEEMQISLRTKCRQRPEIHGEQSGTTAEKVMPDVRDARVRKRATSETFSKSRYTAFTSFSRSRAAGRLGREAWQGRPGREAFPEGTNEAIAEFTTVGTCKRQESPAHVKGSSVRK